MAAQLICNQWVAGSTPVTSSKKSYDIPLKSGVCRGAFAFMSPTASPLFRKIMPPGGVRVLRSAHHAIIIGSAKQRNSKECPNERGYHARLFHHAGPAGADDASAGHRRFSGKEKAHHRPGPRLSDRPAALHHPACEHHPVVPHRVQRGNFPQHPGHPHPVDLIADALRRHLRGVLQLLSLRAEGRHAVRHGLLQRGLPRKPAGGGAVRRGGAAADVVLPHPPAHRDVVGGRVLLHAGRRPRHARGKEKAPPRSAPQDHHPPLHRVGIRGHGHHADPVAAAHLPRQGRPVYQ